MEDREKTLVTKGREKYNLFLSVHGHGETELEFPIFPQQNTPQMSLVNKVCESLFLVWGMFLLLNMLVILSERSAHNELYEICPYRLLTDAHARMYQTLHELDVMFDNMSYRLLCPLDSYLFKLLRSLVSAHVLDCFDEDFSDPDDRAVALHHVSEWLFDTIYNLRRFLLSIAAYTVFSNFLKTPSNNKVLVYILISVLRGSKIVTGTIILLLGEYLVVNVMAALRRRFGNN